MNIKHMDIRNVLLSKIKSEVANSLEKVIDDDITSHLEEIKRNGTLKYYKRNEKRLLNLYMECEIMNKKILTIKGYDVYQSDDEHYGICKEGEFLGFCAYKYLHIVLQQKGI